MKIQLFFPIFLWGISILQNSVGAFDPGLQGSSTYSSQKKDTPDYGEAHIGVVELWPFMNWLFQENFSEIKPLVTGNLLDTSFSEKIFSSDIVEKETVSNGSILITLRKIIRFHDGTSFNAASLLSLLETYKKLSKYTSFFRYIQRVEQTGLWDITFFLKDAPPNKKLLVCTMPIVKNHESLFLKKQAVPPIGIGPYAIKAFYPKKYIVLEKISSWWGQILESSQGLYTLQKIYYHVHPMEKLIQEFKAKKLDMIIGLEEETSDATLPFRQLLQEKSAQGMQDLRVQKLALGQPLPCEAFLFNLQRPLFSSFEVRKAFSHLMAIPSASTRIPSLLPHGFETLKDAPLKELLKDVVLTPQETRFLQEFLPPSTGILFASLTLQDHLSTALEWFTKGGWVLEDGALSHPDFGKCTFTLLMSSDHGKPSFLPKEALLQLKQSMESIGVSMKIEYVSKGEYQKRLDQKDYDLVYTTLFSGDIFSMEEINRLLLVAIQGCQSNHTDSAFYLSVLKKLFANLVQAKNSVQFASAWRLIDKWFLQEALALYGWHHPFQQIAYWNNKITCSKKSLEHPLSLGQWRWKEESNKSSENTLFFESS